MKKLSILICALFAVATVSAQRIAVLDFNAGVGVSQADVDGISSIFNTYFSPSGYTLVERTQIDRVIDEQNFQRGKLTQSQMVRIGQILNVSKVVIGDVNIVMNQYNVDVRVVNVESGTISAKDGATWAPGSSYRTMMSQLGTRLAGKIEAQRKNQLVSQQGTVSIAVVNRMEIISLMPEFKLMETQLEAYQKNLQYELKTLEVEFSNKMESYQRYQDSYSSETKKLKQEELESLQQRYMNYQQTAQENFTKKQAELFEPVEAKFMRAVEAVAISRNCVIIDNQYVLSKGPAMNLNDDIKQRLGL